MRGVGKFWCTRSMHRQIAGALTGRVTKWVVLAAVLVLTGIMGVFSTQLTSVQNNEASSWLPESAESTRVLDELSESVDPNDIPTLVVYHRESGLTDEDLAAMDEQAAEMAKIDGVTDKGALSPNAAIAAQQQGAPGLNCCPRTGRSPTSTSPSTSGRTAGTTSPTPSTRSARSPRSTASRSTLPGSVARPPTPRRPSRGSTPT